MVDKLKTLEELSQEISLAPTVMDLEEEQGFCRQLVQYDFQSIDGKWNLLFEILDRLQESHTDTIYEMTDEDDFTYFVTWANNLANSTENSNFAEGLAGIASMFNVKLHK